MKKLSKLLETIFYVSLSVQPNLIKRFIYNKFLKGEIHKTARIGISYIKVQKLVMGPNSTIKSFNYIKDLELLSLGLNASIGKFNKCTAMPLKDRRNFADEKSRFPALILGQSAAIVSGHFFDCNNTISLGDFTIIAGKGTSFFTHSINIEKNKQETSPIIIGRYCMIAAHNVVVKGAGLPDYCVLGANSMLHKNYTDQYTLYSGVPAEPVKKFLKESLYFIREVGFVP